MSTWAIFFDSSALVLGSLFGAALLVLATWWLAERIRHPRLAPLFLLATIGAMLLGRGVFVHMLAAFTLVGAGLLCCIVGDDGTTGKRRDD